MPLPIEKQLFEAIQKNNEKEVRTLLDKIKTGNEKLQQSFKKFTPASIETKDENGYTSLICAAALGYQGIMKALLENGALVDNPSDNGSTPLMFAAQNGNKDCLALLIKEKANLNAKGLWNRTALMWAAAAGKFDCVKVLLENKVELNIRDAHGCTAFILAAQKEDAASAAALLEAYPDCYDRLKDSPEDMLFAAVTLNNIELLKKAITHVNQITNEANDAINKHPSMTDMIDRSPSINAKNQNNMTPLILASAENRIACIRVLLEQKGIDVNAKDKTGRTALMWAALKGHESCAKLLLEEAKGIDLNVQSRLRKLTALHSAAICDEAKICELLVTHGANTKLECYLGMTAAELGCEQVIKSALKKQKLIHQPARELEPETVTLLSRLSRMWHNFNNTQPAYGRLPTSEQPLSIAIELSSPKKVQ